MTTYQFTLQLMILLNSGIPLLPQTLHCLDLPKKSLFENKMKAYIDKRMILSLST